MLDYALSPEEHRTYTAVCYKELFETYPETRPWVDSLRRKEALRDTFVIQIYPVDSQRYRFVALNEIGRMMVAGSDVTDITDGIR